MVYCLSGASGHQTQALNLFTNERKSISGVKNRLNEVDDTDGNRHMADLEIKFTRTLLMCLMCGLNRAEAKIDWHFSPQWASCDTTACDLPSNTQRSIIIGRKGHFLTVVYYCMSDKFKMYPILKKNIIEIMSQKSLIKIPINFIVLAKKRMKNDAHFPKMKTRE